MTSHSKLILLSTEWLQGHPMEPNEFFRVRLLRNRTSFLLSLPTQSTSSLAGCGTTACARTASPRAKSSAWSFGTLNRSPVWHWTPAVQDTWWAGRETRPRSFGRWVCPWERPPSSACGPFKCCAAMTSPSPAWLSPLISTWQYPGLRMARSTFTRLKRVTIFVPSSRRIQASTLRSLTWVCPLRVRWSFQVFLLFHL